MKNFLIGLAVGYVLTKKKTAKGVPIMATPPPSAPIIPTGTIKPSIKYTSPITTRELQKPILVMDSNGNLLRNA